MHAAAAHKRAAGKPPYPQALKAAILEYSFDFAISWLRQP